MMTMISSLATNPSQEILIVLDALNPFLGSARSADALHIPGFLSALITGPSVSLVATYHTDVPLITPSAAAAHGSGGGGANEYAPQALATLTHLATAVLRTGSVRREVDRRAARARSRPDPGWGVGEGREGVVLGFRRVVGGGGREEGGGLPDRSIGLVLDMELRRRSGRAVAERFVLVPGASTSAPTTTTITTTTPPRKASRIFLLAEHPLFLDPTTTTTTDGAGEGDEEPASTFDLGLTDKQRRDRAGVVLPYFDAQTDVGSAAEGGRILYEMGREDDFDDEEDEI